MTDDKLSWYIVLGLLLIAAFFVVAAYDRQLPIAELDEGILLSQTIRDRGLSNFDVFTVSGYPPLILQLFRVTQHITEAILQESVLNHAGLVLRIVRILAIFANIFTVILMFLIGKKLDYPLVGLMSAIGWAVLPLINQQTSQALTEPWQILFISASAWAMLQTLESRKAVWAISCTIFGLLAILSKYNTFPILGLGIGITLWLLIRDNRKKHWISVFAIQVILISLTAYSLLFVYGAKDLLAVGRPEATQFVDNGFQALFNFSTVLYIFTTASIQVGLFHVIILVSIIWLGFYLLCSKKDLDTCVALLLLLVFVVVFIWLVPTYLVYDVLKFRYISSATSILVLIISLSLYQISALISSGVSVLKHEKLIFIFLSIIWLTPPMLTRLSELWQLQYPDTGQAVVEWSASTLEPNATLAVTGIDGNTMRWRYFNNVWGNYTGPNRPLIDIFLYLQEPISVWIDDGIEYVHLTGNFPGDFPTLPFPVEDMLLMKAFPPQGSDQNWRGDSWFIYRLQSYQNEVTYQFADGIHLRGYDISTTTVQAGEHIDIRTYWQASQTPQRDYHFFIHLSAMHEHNVYAQVDGTPSLTTRMTSTWEDPREILVSPQFQLLVSPDLSEGEYRLLLGLYDPTTGQRLTVQDNRDFIQLTNILVESPD